MQEIFQWTKAFVQNIQSVHQYMLKICPIILYRWKKYWHPNWVKIL